MLNENLREITAPDHKPHKLIAIAEKQETSDINLSIVVLNEKINHNRIDEISFVEWIWCIDNDKLWENLSPSEQISLSIKIWAISLKITWLYSILIRRLAWFYSGNKNVIASFLVNGFKRWSNSDSVQKNLVIRVIMALGENNPKQELVKIACNYYLTRSELLSKINYFLPNIPVLKEYVQEISPYFSKINPVTLEQVNWLLRCFDEMEQIIQIQAVDYILNHLSTEIVVRFPELVNWLKRNYNSSEKQSKLSNQGKQKFRDWVGAINYNDFCQFVDLIIKKISLTEREENQLKKRKDFWANYSNSFMRIKILLPTESYQMINNLLREDQDVKKLQFDGSDLTEICIFDLGDKGFIVEFFRGRCSETRVFPQKDYIKAILFDSESLSVKKIRSLGGEAHDHAICWQWSCEKLLREKYLILPNMETKYFIGLPQEYGRYNISEGLSEPNLEKQYERQRQIQQWKLIISKLESEAKEFLY